MSAKNNTKFYLIVLLCLFLLAQVSLVMALDNDLLYESISNITFISDKPHVTDEEIFIRIGIKNTSTEVLSGSFRVVVENASLPVTNAAGLTALNEPYFLLKNGGDVTLKPGKKVYSRISFSESETVALLYNLRLERRISPSLNRQPVANAGFDQFRKPDDIVYLDASRSYDLDGEVLSYDWLLEKKPAGSLTALVNDDKANSHFKLDITGLYIIALLVNDGIENSYYDRVVITTSNVPPVAQAGASQLVILGDIVQLDGSFSSDANGDNLTYSWKIDQSPDGSTAVIENADSVQAELNIDLSGEYLVRLKVNDGAAESDDFHLTISDTGLPPVANAGLDQPAIINAVIQLDASASLAMDAQPLDYSWALISAPEHSSASLTQTQSMNPMIQIDQAGDYIVQLMVNDGRQSSFPDQVIISTNNIRPVADADENRTVLVNTSTQLNATNSFDADGDLLNYQWSVIHQPETSTTSITNVSDIITSFIADVSGLYVVQLVVNDGRLDSYADTILITAEEQANMSPVIQSTPVLTAQTDTLYHYAVIATDDNDDSLTYSLRQSPAGMMIDDSSGLIHWAPDMAGSYPVNVLVSDGQGGEDEQQFIITVQPLNVAPVITSAPVGQAIIDLPYRYQVLASDADADSLTYHLPVAPLGMSINVATGLVSWLPVNFEAANVVIEVDDARGGKVSQQYTVSTAYPADNQPPVFDTLADRVVPVGTTLNLLFSALDPEGEVIRYAVSPLPLPANATLNAETGVFVFTPQAEQAGEYNFAISASDTRFSTSQTLKITVPPIDLLQATSFHGRVMDANSASQGVELPIVGATISFLNTAVLTVTDALGYFTLNNLPPTAEVFSIDGGTAKLAPGGASYASFRELLSLIQHSQNIEQRPFYMPRNNMASMTQVDPNQATIVENEELGVMLEIPPHTATNEDGTVFLGQISISEVPNGLAPASMPENFNPGLLITIQPAGIRFSTPVPITFPNTDNLVPGTEFSIMSVDPDTGMFAPVGTAVVSADGKSIITTSGGIIEADWHFPSVQAVDNIEVNVSKNPGVNPQCTGSTTCLKDGRMSQTVRLPVYRSLQADRAVALTYQTIRAGQVVQALQNHGDRPFTNYPRIPVKIKYKQVAASSGSGDVQTGQANPTPDYTKITTTIAGIEGQATYLGLPPLNQDNVFTGVSLDVPDSLGTGLYTANTRVVVKIGFSVSGVVSDTETMIINESLSPFGAGWMIEDIDRLHFHNDSGNALLVSADGRYKIFEFDINTQTYVTPQGDFSTLEKNPDNSGYRLTDQFGNTDFFNALGQQSEKQDLNGNSTRYKYNVDGELTSVTDPVGKQTLFNYANSRIISITDPASRMTRFEHDSLGNLIRIIYPDNSTIKYEYAGHLLTKKTDESNNVTQYHYDENGFNTHVTLADNSQRSVKSALSIGFAGNSNTIDNRQESFTEFSRGSYFNARGLGSYSELDDQGFVSSHVDALGRVTLYERDANSRPLKTTRANGSVVTKIFDISGNMTSEHEEFNGASYSYEYDDFSLISKITNPNNHSVTIRRDSNGNPVEITNELGHITTIDFDTNGLPTRILTPNNLEVVRRYNTDGLLETQVETPPTGSPGNVRTSQYQYFANGFLKQLDTGDGRTYRYTYDQRSRLLSITDNLGQKQTAQYDSYGNIITVDSSNADGSGAMYVEYNYDNRNRLTEIRLPHQQIDAITRLLLDGEGNVFELIDPKGSQRKMHYDKVDRLNENIHRLNGVSQYSFDFNDQISKIINPNGATTVYSYDLLGRRLSEISPDRGILQYQYDLADNLTQQIDARGIITDYSYDELERLSSKTFPASPAENITLQYDACPLGLGRLCNIIDETGVSRYQYDAWGNIVQQQKTELGQTYTTSYQYDEGNNVSQMIYPSGRIISITRDGLRRMLSIQTSLNQSGATDSKTLMVNSLYRADGQLTQSSFGNGLSESRSYDLQGRLTSQNTENGAAITDQRLYDYDINSNLITRTGTAQNSTYNYDLLDRLTLDNPGITQNLAARQSTLQYDQNHNRLRKTSYLLDQANVQSTQTKAYIYNSLSNQLLAAETLSESLALTTNSENEQLQYNAANRLSHRIVSNANGDLLKATEYLYNAQGQRTRKISLQQNGSSITTLYHYNLEGQLISESSELGTNIRDYVWHNLSPITQIEHDQQAANDVVYYLHTDHLFTPRFATNENKQIVWRWQGEAFGETEVEGDVDGDGQLATINLRFPGQYYDVESGNHYNYFRDYDPSIGRYITSDPIGLLGGANTYAYVGGNPVVYIDQYGLICISNGAISLISGALGGAATGLLSSGNLGGAAVGAILGGATSYIASNVGPYGAAGVGTVAGAFRGGSLGGAVGGFASAAASGTSGGNTVAGAVGGFIGGALAKPKRFGGPKSIGGLMLKGAWQGAAGGVVQDGAAALLESISDCDNDNNCS